MSFQKKAPLESHRLIRGTSEYESFINFVKEDAHEAISVAFKILIAEKTQGPEDPFRPIILAALLDKLLTPEVFLWAEWLKLPSAEREKYATPEYLEELKKVSSEVDQMTQR